MTHNISRPENKELTRTSTVSSTGVIVAISNVSSNELIKDSVAPKCSTVSRCRSLDNGTPTQRKGSQHKKPSIFIPNLDDIYIDPSGKDLLGSTKPKSVDIYGVRVVPGVVLFENTFENQIYMEKVCVQNISKNCVTVRIYNPRAWSFRILSLEQGYQLAPGLSITRRLHYTCTKTGIVRSSLPIYIDDKCFELPLEAYKGQAFVEIVPTCVNFGRVDIGGKALERKVEIRNVSSCATKFLVDLGRSDLDLQVTPVKGWIRPHSVITLRLQLTVREAGELSSEIWITTDLSQTRIHIVVQACKRSLLAFHPNTTSDFTLIEFPTTFFGCRCYQTIVIYNMAAASSAFVVLADFGNNNLQPLKQAHSDSHASAQMFAVEPLEGRIKPFEGRVFTIWFQPQQCEKPKFGWKSKFVEEMNDYLYAVRIKRIQVDDVGGDSMLQSNEDMNIVYHKKVTTRTSVPNMDILVEKPVEKPTETPQVTMLDDISVLLCLYGEAEFPSLNVVPDTLYFGELHVGDREKKVVHVTNSSKQKVFFRYKKKPFFDVSPSFTIVEPTKTVDVSVKHNCRNLGALKRKLTFEVLAKNSDEIDFVVLNYFTVHVNGIVNADIIHPKPKFNHGITPMITHEVGFLTDDITFLTAIEKPKCAMAAVKDRDRPWLHSDAKIAFPNDRPLTIRPRPIDYSSKTIFKGLTCHIPPVDQTLTYTIEQLLYKKAHDKRMTLYIRGTAAQSLSKVPKVSRYEQGYRDVQPDPPSLLSEKVNPNIPRELFVPLTFIQLYRIRASPPFISFGKVTTSKNCLQLLIIENSNDFDVGAKMIPVTPGVSIQTLDNFVLKANSETKITTTFNRENLGKYNGIITCVINGYHSFDIPVTAEVVPKTLVVTPNRVEYRLPEVPFAPYFVPLEVKNPLNTAVSFSWYVPEGSPFKIEPHFGMTYKKSLMWCAAYFEPDSPNYKLYPLKLLVEGHVCNKLKCGIILPKPNVYFLDSTLNIGSIPSNINTMKIFVVFNPDFWDAMFVVLNKEPMKGVMVEPHAGTIKARSCFNLILNIKMTTEGPFEFVVYMNIQHSATIEMKVVGVLEHPHVEVTPKYINLKRVHCHSICRTTLVFENKSKANSEISFDLKDYPQFKVSLSKRYHDMNIPSQGLELEPESSRKVYLHFIPSDLASYDFYLPVLINGINFNFPEKDLETHTKMVKTIYKNLSATTSKKTVLASKLKETLSSLVFIDVSVLKPQLTFSSLELCFLENSISKSFITTNVSDEPLNISFRWEESHSTFKFEANKQFLSKEKNTLFYKITPNEDIELNVTVVQASPGTNTLDVVVQVAHDEQWIVYNYIRLSTTVQKPYVIYPSVEVIHFLPVPLEVDISVAMYLTVEVSSHLNNQTTVDYEIKGPNAILFKLEFTKGNLVSGSINPTVLPVKITFSSLHPISFKTVINFSIGNIGKCHIIMTATADNCVLTTHAYLKSHSNSSKVLQEYDDSIDKAEVETSFSPIVDHNIPKRKYKALAKSSIRKSFSIMSMSSLKTYLSTSVTGNKSNVFSSTKESSRSSGTGNGIHITAVSDIELPLPKDPTDYSTVSPIQDHIEIAHKENSDEYCFPMYPLEPTVTEYAVHMKQTRCAVQRWIYEQVFHCSYYPTLGSHSFSTFVQTKKDYGRATPVALRNVFDVLERICGRGVRRYFTTLDKLPEDTTARVHFIYNIYKQLIEFLVVQGAFLSHVEPKYLMAYADYTAYFKVLPSSGETSLDSNSIEGAGSVLLSSSEFKSISIQCWMDVFLQMYKTLILIPTINNKMSPTEIETLKRIVAAQDIEFRKKMYSRAEEVLMAWLTYNYNNQRSVVWPNQPPSERTITNYDTDLEDGLVLAAVTATYCPYLIATHFYQMFTQPKTVSQAYHNTVCLSLAWNRIKLGFSVTPRDFSKPNAVNMLILIVHLYHILPTYKPESTIKFMATLNSCEIQVVSLENTEDSNVTYKIEILQNSTSFSLENSTETFLLKRKETGKINVRYTARNTTKAHAILLLCGACMPPRFGRNYVFRLEGYAVKLPVSAVFKIISPLNAPLTTSLCIETPHVQDTKVASYDIWISDNVPQPGNLNAVCWAKEKKRKIPRRLFLLSDKLTVEINKRQRTGKLDMRVCCFSQSVHNYWLLFMSEDIGDFFVKLVISPGPPEPTSTLRTLTLDPAVRCSCGGSDKSLSCNRTEYIYVPCRNLDQWAAVRTMFELTISPSEQEFWSTYIESHIGYRLLQWMLEEKKEKLNQEIKLLFKTSKTYKVSCKSPYIFCEPLIHVSNVRSKGLLPIKVHFAQDCPNFSTVLTLTSSDGEEIRCYNIDVTSK